MLKGTAMARAIADETRVPKIKGRAPNCLLTGFQSELTKNRQPNFESAGREPRANSNPMRTIRAKTLAAIPSVNHLKARSLRTRRTRCLEAGNCRVTVATGMRSIFYCLDALQHPAPQTGRQRRIIEGGGHAFALGQRPIEEFDQFLAFGSVFLLFIDQQPGSSRDRIGILAGRIDH